MEDKKSLDELEDSGDLMEYLKSEKFQQAMLERIKEDTWKEGLPMIYMDKEGWLVKEWKDGKIEKIKKLQ
jgi:hypothetical protein